MKTIVRVQTTKRVFKRERSGNIVTEQPLTLEVAMKIDSNVIRLGYGYKTWTTEHVEDAASVCPGERYKLHHSIRPKEGDVWQIGQRTFVLGKPAGFLNYTAPLLEGGKKVAEVKFEEYYKD